jgi:hypothetical protein
MVNSNKIKRRLPGLLIDDLVGSTDAEYQQKRYKVNQLQRKQPTVFHTLLNNISVAIDELDRAAEEAGFQQVVWEDGQIKKKWKYRTN